MSVEIDSNTPGMAEANAELDRLMAADASSKDQGQGSPDTGSATDQEQRAAQAAEVKSTQDLATKTNDTPATAAEKSNNQQSTSKEDPSAKDQTPSPKEEPKLSRYEKARQREQKGWEALNAEKAAIKAEREKFELERKEFEGKAKAAQEQFTPEQYDKAAEQFEASGKFDLAELAKKKAEELRKNPPAKVADEAKAKTEASRKEWTLKAGVDFPELTKEKSPLNGRVREMLEEEPDLKAHPKGIYLAARLASLEAAAAGVPGMETELGKLRAKVKELEILTAPGGGGGSAIQVQGARSFEQMNDTEQLAELEKLAHEQVTLR